MEVTREFIKKEEPERRKGSFRIAMALGRWVLRRQDVYRELSGVGL